MLNLKQNNEKHFITFPRPCVCVCAKNNRAAKRMTERRSHKQTESTYLFQCAFDRRARAALTAITATCVS